MNQDNHLFKVVLVFNLEPGTAEEELRRSAEPDSFPSRLAAQPGFIGMELVKVADDRTMSIQTWQSPSDWWSALEQVKQMPAPPADERPNILVSRDFYAGPVMASR